METLMGVQWRLDVIVLSRACKRQKEPQMILQLETNKGLVNMTVTPQDLEVKKTSFFVFSKCR